jgi:hypothetical protein
VIRALAILSGLALGAGAGVLVGVRAGHLAALPGVAPPSWSAGLAPDAGLARGAAQVAGARIAWRMTMRGGALPTWLVDVAAPGADLTLEVHPRLSGPEMTGARGTVDLAQALPPLEDLDLRGALVMRDGAGAADWRAGTLQRLDLGGRAVDIAWQGHPLGAFDMTLEMRRPTWRADLVPVAGNPVQARLGLRGLSGGAALQIDLQIDDGPNLPEDLRRILQRAVPFDDGTWRLQRRIPISQPIP